MMLAKMGPRRNLNCCIGDASAGASTGGLVSLTEPCIASSHCRPRPCCTVPLTSTQRPVSSLVSSASSKSLPRGRRFVNDWRAWADTFTEDATYIEQHYGTMQGREAIYEWISKTMAEWPNSEMKEFPHDWCVCDEERGWWICQIENRFRDPGDGEVYQAYNLTVLKYAGNMQFSSEEDAYNPANFAPVVKAWIEAERRNRTD